MHYTYITDPPTPQKSYTWGETSDYGKLYTRYKIMLTITNYKNKLTVKTLCFSIIMLFFKVSFRSVTLRHKMFVNKVCKYINIENLF